MPVAERFRRRPEPAEVTAYTELCHAIESELAGLLAKLAPDEVPELRELVTLRGPACVDRMRALGLVAAAEGVEPAAVPTNEPASALAVSPVSTALTAHEERVMYAKFGEGVVRSREAKFVTPI